jgi:hypothetical protein
MVYSSKEILLTSIVRLKLSAALLLAVALACSAPSVAPQPAPTGMAVTTIPPTATPLPTPTTAPTPTIIAGWQSYQDANLNVAFFHPEIWEVTALGTEALDIRQPDGHGWMQLMVLSGTGNNDFALTYTPGMTGDSLIAALLPSAREDGTFSDPQSLATRSAQPAWLIEGHNDMHNEETIIAALGLPQRGIILICHGGELPEDWPALSEVYKGIIGSLEAAQ